MLEKVSRQGEPPQWLLLIEALCIEATGAPEGAKILENAGLQIGYNETLAVIGESGSGKTMSALAALGLLPANLQASGAVIFKGKNLLTAGETYLNTLRGRHIAMIFQHANTAFNPTFTIGAQMVEVICTHLNLRKHPAKQRALNLLSEVGLPDADLVFHAYPHQLSGGMAQRAMIAMGLSCSPQLVIADEPTSALDIKTQRAMISLLQRMQRDYGFSLWLISHDLALVAEIADKIAVMHNGCIVESGVTNSILQSPRHAYTRLLLSQSKFKDKMQIPQMTVEQVR